MLIRKSSSSPLQFSSTRTILVVIIIILLLILPIKLFFFPTPSAKQPVAKSTSQQVTPTAPLDAFSAQVQDMFNHNTNLISGTVTMVDTTTNTLHINAKNASEKVSDMTIKIDPSTVIFQKPSSATQTTYQKVMFNQIKSPYLVYVYGATISANNQIQAKGISVDLPPVSASSPTRHRIRGVTP